MHQKSGFSLMELMITIAIISIIASVATPNVLQWMANRKLNAGIQNLYAQMQGARLRAVKENIHVIIAFNTAGNSYRTFLDTNRNNLWEPGTDQELGSANMPSGVSITTVVFTGGIPSQIGFDGRGLPSGTGSVLLTDKQGKTRFVGVNVTGGIQIGS